MKFMSTIGRIAMLAVAAIAALNVPATLAAAVSRLLDSVRQPQYQLNGTLTLTGLIPTIYEAMDIVSRELVGFVRAVSGDFNGERAALNQTVRSPVVGAMAAEDVAAAAYAPDTPSQTIGYVDMTISKSRQVPFGVTGEESKTLQTGGMLARVNRDRIAQAIRTLTNEVEADLASLHTKASRTYGTYNAVPFGTAADFSDFAQTLKILDDNGAPQSDRHMVLGGSSIANLRGKQSSLFKVNEAGSEDLLRNGRLGNVLGYDIHNSGQVKTAVTVGTGSGYTSSSAALTVGQTDVPVITGTGTILAGDIITFANDPNYYVVKTGVAAPGTITLAEPGIRFAQGAATRAITIIAATTRNMFFHRSAIQLTTRAPAMPEGGDSADDSIIITDPISGIAYEFLVYRQKRQVRYEVALAWGFQMIAPRHAGLLIGA